MGECLSLPLRYAKALESIATAWDWRAIECPVCGCAVERRRFPSG
jgi:hypothetical protein